MIFQPLYDRLLIRRTDAPDKVGGLYIPDNAREKPCRGIIVSAGDGKMQADGILVPLNVKEGDDVLFGKYAGSEIELDGEQLLIVREDEIMGIFRQSKARLKSA
jgi:chaperonin GroES